MRDHIVKEEQVHFCVSGCFGVVLLHDSGQGAAEGVFVRDFFVDWEDGVELHEGAEENVCGVLVEVIKSNETFVVFAFFGLQVHTGVDERLFVFFGD